MSRPRKTSRIATGVFKDLVAQPKLTKIMPSGCVLTEQDARTKLVDHIPVGSLGRNRIPQLERIGNAALMVLGKTSVLKVGDPPIPVAGLKTKNGDRYVVSGMEHDLGELSLGVYLARYTILTRDEVLKIWEDSGNRYVLGNVLFI